MIRALIFLVLGTLVSFLFQYFLSGTGNAKIDLYYAFAFGLGWGMAYFVDRPDWALPKKMGFSLIGVIMLVIIGFAFFNFEIAIPSIIRFSTVFVAYYLIASFRDSKSLRQ
ncbi:hypothetical protein G6R40_12860 [Chryseobacterium sp. POL2]|uniref:hypothetical protein n=1 Tax=Chryseobacterium sp. POL2 TaxID=2713414 RepID=UPI0013E0F21A|nr:hypothetical protein [Chryseobacterium sp. POL2]QIG90488.1 hypothetical protein G6R40_12860 [Chryseobacterium sp. POL2]